MSKRHMQARGKARREILLNAANDLLHETRMGEITLPMIAEHAGIPPSSTYHFFPDVRELFKELASTIVEEMTQLTPSTERFMRWDEFVASFLGLSAAYFNANPAARQLLLGAESAPDIKIAACHDDLRFGALLYQALDSAFHLPQMEKPIRRFFFAIQIADTFFSLSVMENEMITDEMLEEAVIGATSYLSTFLPPILAAKEPTPQASERRTPHAPPLKVPTLASKAGRGKS